MGYASCQWQALRWLFGTNPTISNRVYIKASFAWIARAFPITAAHRQTHIVSSFHLHRSWSRWPEGFADSSHLLGLVRTIHYMNVEIICRNQAKMWGKKNDAEVSDYSAEKQTYMLSLLWINSTLNRFSTEQNLILNPGWSGCTMGVWIYC